MVEKLNFENEEILAFKVDGKVKLDEEKEVINYLKSNLEKPSNFKGYVEIHNFQGIELQALWERLKFTVSNFSELSKKMEKIALVTEKEWLQKMAEGIYKLIPGIQLQTFALEEADQAKNWLNQ
ncbi:MAG: STAS/SEC14 domain-containing protein [Cytophagaceae bacterium]